MKEIRDQCKYVVCASHKQDFVKNGHEICIVPVSEDENAKWNLSNHKREICSFVKLPTWAVLRS